MQNTAIGFSICVDNVAERIHGLMKDLQKFYKVFKDNNVDLVTVRHYEKSIVEQLKKGKMILLEERIRGTLKMVVKNVPIMERINR
jgi:aspartate kinase